MGAVTAYEIPSFVLGVIPANVDLSSETAGQFCAVDVIPATGAGLSGPAIALPGAGAAILGVLQNNPVLGEVAEVMVAGVSKARLSGTVTEGALLMADAAGKLLVATTGNQAVAKALSSGVAGDVCPVLLKSYGKV